MAIETIEMITFFFNNRGEILTKREGILNSVDLSDEDLRGLQLSSLTMQGARFDGANLTNACVANCDLYWSSFADANCSDAYFLNCVLVGAIFRGSNLDGTTFENCRFFGPDGTNGPDFDNTALERCKLIQCDLTMPNGNRQEMNWKRPKNC